MYIFDVKTKIIECINNKRVYRDFLLKIKKLTFIFVEMRQFLFILIFDYYAIFIKIINDFRQHMRIKKIRTKKKTIFNLTFVVDENKKSINRTFLFRN